MAKNLTERVERKMRFFHNGKSIFLTPEYKDGSTIYTVNCAGERLASGELPLKFCYEGAWLEIKMGLGKDRSPQGKSVDVQKPTICCWGITGTQEDLGYKDN